jgi:heme exporter protein C
MPSIRTIINFSERAWPLVLLAGLLTLAGGLYLSLVGSPEDYQQGNTVRIMYVHVPSAWLAMGLYVGVAVNSVMFLVWRHPVADIFAESMARVGVVVTIICLITGMLWGKPMWGAYWVWDARLTSMFVLLLLYVGYLVLYHTSRPTERLPTMPALLAIVGVVNIPIIKFSVEWWNTLHQPASVIRAGGASIDPSMLLPLLVMATAFSLLALAAVLLFFLGSAYQRQARRS